jgi:hypothetical protein
MRLPEADPEHLDFLVGQSAALRHMLQAKLPLTKQTYLDLNWPFDPPQGPEDMSDEEAEILSLLK